LDRILALEKQIAFTEKLVDLEANRARDAARLELTREISLRNRTKLNREAEADRLKIVELQQQERYIQGQIALLEFQKADASETFSRAQEDQLDLLRRQKDLLQEQQETIRNNYNLMQQFANATNQSFETGLQRGLTAIFKGQESSLKDAVLGIAKSMVESVAEVAAENLTRMITGSFSGVQIASSIAAGGATAASTISSAMIAAGSAVAGMLGASSIAAPVVSSIGSLVGIPAGNRLGLGRVGLNPNFTAAEKLGSMFGPGITATFANGGIMKGGFQSYANGGIINQPTVGLVGEGRFNEAVVPLPNGKAIPVDMKGSGGVTVNVAVNNNGSATTSVEGAQQQSANFGKAIAMAVQKEIQNQKRSGGMLSPYGAA